ncbi:MAG: sensor histidine kinase [Planctomycetota bacterium]
MKPLSIRASLTAWFVGLTTVLLVVFSATLYWNLAAALEEGLDSKLETAAAGLLVLVDWDEELWAPEFEIPEELAQQLSASLPQVRQQIYAWPSATALHETGLPIEAPLPEEAVHAGHDFDAGPLHFWEDLHTEEGHLRLCTVIAQTPPVPAEDGDPAKPAFLVLARVAQDMTEVDAEIADLAWSVAGAIGISILLILGFATLLSRRVVQPLQALGHAADEIRAGRSVSIPHRGADDEVDALSEHLSVAFQRLEDALQKQTRFTSDAAHELRNPITVIRNAAEVALHRDRRPEEYRELFGDVLDTSKRMGEVMEALLLLARLDAGTVRARFQPVDLAAIVTDSASNMPRGVERFRIQAQAPLFVHGDDTLLRVLVDNLLSNALRYSEAGTVVTIKVEDGARILLTVEDHGPGFPEDALPHVFERFYRADSVQPEAKGAGLGLALVAEIARAHNAELEASNTSEGARITVRF